MMRTVGMPARYAFVANDLRPVWLETSLYFGIDRLTNWVPRVYSHSTFSVMPAFRQSVFTHLLKFVCESLYLTAPPCLTTSAEWDANKCARFGCSDSQDVALYIVVLQGS